MERNIASFDESDEARINEQIAVRRLGQEFQQNYQTFKKSEGFETIFPLLVIDYKEDSETPLITYSKDSQTADITPEALRYEVLPMVGSDIGAFPGTITLTATEPYGEFPFILTPRLAKHSDETVKKTSTIYALKDKSPFLSDLRRVVITRLYGRYGILNTHVGEIWIARRWRDAGLHQRISELATT